MPVTVKERDKYRSESGHDAQRKWVILGATSSTAARAAMLADSGVPTVIDGKARIEIECDVDELAENIFEGTTKYALQQWELPVTDTVKVSFDITGTNAKIKQARAHISDKAATGFTQRNFHGAIGVTAEGDVEGVDVLIPSLCYTVTKTYSEAQVTASFIENLANAVGCTNLSTYRGFSVNTLLLTRASGSPRADPNDPNSTVYDITFSFAFSRTETSLVISPEITVPEKEGWDYLWVYYEQAKDTDSSAVLPRPRQAVVDRVYWSYDFTSLGI
jgi:hypothetical protein